MRIQLLPRPAGDEERGFTLIELLIVIIIIGILAAIAIPVFLNQREKAYDAAAKQDLRNLANFEEIYLNDFETYGTANAVILAEPRMSASSKITLMVKRYSGDGYCLEADVNGTTRKWIYDSLDGGVQPFGTVDCSVFSAGYHDASGGGTPIPDGTPLVVP